jgi:hypothetical protein
MLLVGLLAFASLALPLLWAWRLARLDEPTRGRWLIKAADILAFVALVVLAARWDILGIHTRTAVLLVVVAALVRSLRRHAARPWRAAAPWPRSDRWSTAGSLALMLGLAGYVVTGLLPPGGAYALGCPLAGGRFIVGQGGGNGLVNHHSGHRAQDRAADILALGPWGFRAPGALPRDLERYAVHRAAVVSPCAGEVVATRDGLPDLTPPERDPEHAAGNQVVLACGTVRVELAHLAPGSLAVGEGHRVAAGDAIGRVGNSGNTTEPHLHIHAVDAVTGLAVPITLAGRAPVRNRILDC